MMISDTSCPVCDSPDYSSFLQASQVPVYVGALWPSREAARNCPKGDFKLAYCNNCGFVGNTAFDDALMDYEVSYDNALHFSSVFKEYENALAARLIERYDVRNKTVMEIGCGGGHFLGILCALGGNRGVGYDPSFEPTRKDPALTDDVRILKEHFSASAGQSIGDLICCRHVLEHIPQPRHFLEMLRAAIDQRTDVVLYFEVPNARLILSRLSIWDIMYEHCCYFARESLVALFEGCGFDVLDVRQEYDEQFVSIEVRPGTKNSDQAISAAQGTADLDNLVAAFPRRFQEVRHRWQEDLADIEGGQQSAVIWGAGGKAVGFVNLLDIGSQIEAAVDVNPGKQGTFLAGGGHPIVKPQELQEMKPDTVIVMNPAYESEIAESLNAMGLHPQLRVV